MVRTQLQSCLDETGPITYLRTQPDIAAYLFGSHAQGPAQPRSDVDVAVLLDEVPEGRTAFICRNLLGYRKASGSSGRVSL